MAWIGAFTGPVIAATALSKAFADTRRREHAAAKALLYLVHHAAAMTTNLAETEPGPGIDIPDYLRGDAPKLFKGMADDKLPKIDVFQIPSSKAFDTYHSVIGDCHALADRLPQLANKSAPEIAKELTQHSDKFRSHAKAVADVAKTLGAKAHDGDHSTIAQYLPRPLLSKFTSNLNFLSQRRRRKNRQA